MKHVPIFCFLFSLSLCAGALVRFPDQFRASVGTTIPLLDTEPIAQSGAIYYDAIHNRFRVDSFWMNTSHSIIANFATGDYSVLSNGLCRRVRTKKMSHGATMPPFGVPDGFMRHADSFAVRGVPTYRFSGVERGEYLMQVNYYIRNMTVAVETIDAEGVSHNELKIPSLWRIQSQRSRRRELRAPTATSPNWRWFGQPMNELTVPDEPYMKSVDLLVENVPITMDFFDFVPTMPDPQLFILPRNCDLVNEEGHDDGQDVNIFAAQRLLVDLSFFSRQGTQAVMNMHASRVESTPIASEEENPL